MLLQHGVFHNLTVIGEAARSIPREFRDRFPDAPWPKIIALRNVIAHEYHRLRTDLIWAIIRDDLPELKKQVERMLTCVDE